MRGKHDLQEHVLRIEHENAGYIGANARLRFNGFVTSSAISRTDLGKKGHPARGTLPGIICVCIGGWLYLREQYAAGDRICRLADEVRGYDDGCLLRRTADAGALLSLSICILICRGQGNGFVEAVPYNVSSEAYIIHDYFAC